MSGNDAGTLVSLINLGALLLTTIPSIVGEILSDKKRCSGHLLP
ncbi:hypothetical protein KF201_1919 [Lactococcus lactis subsp. lactis]|jgi:hypothetical protein|nr:hypothetical protein LKF67_0669 [Lactococcus lactis subsp. lactis]KSU00478.1 hypothetical protein KF201_1919 [Lactococcus lactis subsp. lactis]